MYNIYISGGCCSGGNLGFNVSCVCRLTEWGIGIVEFFFWFKRDNLFEGVYYYSFYKCGYSSISWGFNYKNYYFAR